MADEYTPTTAYVRTIYSRCPVDSLNGGAPNPTPEYAGEQFDRWLAQHDREVKAAALRGAADAIELPGSDVTGYYSGEVVTGYREAEGHAEHWLRARADRVERGEES